jgi:alpha-glucosidase
VWEDAGADAVAFRRGDVHVLANLGTEPIPLPAGAFVILQSQLFDGGAVPVDTAVWYTTA